MSYETNNSDERSSDRKESTERKERVERSDGNSGCSILIKNLDQSITIDKLKEHCLHFGNIKDVHIPLEFPSRRPKTFGFVEFEDQNNATAAQEGLNNTEFFGKTLEVFVANTGRKSRDDMKSQYGSRNNRRPYDDNRRQGDYRDDRRRDFDYRDDRRRDFDYRRDDRRREDDYRRDQSRREDEYRRDHRRREDYEDYRRRDERRDERRSRSRDRKYESYRERY